MSAGSRLHSVHQEYLANREERAARQQAAGEKEMEEMKSADARRAAERAAKRAAEATAKDEV